MTAAVETARLGIVAELMTIRDDLEKQSRELYGKANAWGFYLTRWKGIDKVVNYVDWANTAVSIEKFLDNMVCTDQWRVRIEQALKAIQVKKLALKAGWKGVDKGLEWLKKLEGLLGKLAGLAKILKDIYFTATKLLKVFKAATLPGQIQAGVSLGVSIEKWISKGRRHQLTQEMDGMWKQADGFSRDAKTVNRGIVELLR